MERISLYREGVVFEDVARLRGASVKRGGGVRGKISSFTSAACLRLRSALLRLRLRYGARVGVTLTLPWTVQDWSSVMGDFRAVLHRFRVYWLRRFPYSGAIYRVELQQRGAPHLHMVSWHKLPLPDNLCSIYFGLWWDSLQHDLRGGSMSDFARRGVRLDEHLNVIGSIRYLCDHASKRKQAQLGYKGKQWGILGKANLTLYDGMPFDLTARESVLLRRWLSRLLRFRVKSDCVFGSRLSRRASRRKICFLSDDSVLRLFSLLEVSCV